DRRSVPALPGSDTPTSTRASGPAAAAASAGDGTAKRATAATGRGVTASTTLASAPGRVRCTVAPARAARSSRSSGQSGSATTSSTGTPASSASASRIGPSITYARSSVRALRRPERRRRRCMGRGRVPVGSTVSAGARSRRRGGRGGGPGRRGGGGGGPREGRDGVLVGDGQVGQHLAVALDAGGSEAGHEHAVARAVLAARGVDALDPQPPEVALAGPPVAVGV